MGQMLELWPPAMGPRIVCCGMIDVRDNTQGNSEFKPAQAHSFGLVILVKLRTPLCSVDVV